MNKDIELVELIASTLPDNIESLATGKSDDPASFNLKKILLWLILITGVVFMAIMAYRLAKKKKSET